MDTEHMNGSLAPIPQRPDNLTAQVFAAIRDRIVDASLSPGSSVSEAMLASQLQVSKTPVREALLRLRHIGLVEPTTRGVRVVEPSATLIRDAFEYRAGVEAVSARYAAARSTPAHNAAILDAARESLRAAKARNTEGFRQADLEFHLAVARATENSVLLDGVENSFVLCMALRLRDVHLDRDFVPDAKEHVAVAELVKAGAQEKAAEALANHVSRIMTQLLDAMADAEAESVS